jgi:hypothetical protein
MPFLTDDDPLGVDEFATHRLPLADAAAAYGMFSARPTARSRSCLSRGRDLAVIIPETCFASRTSG